jgi:hypothetical protein
MNTEQREREAGVQPTHPRETTDPSFDGLITSQ